MREVLNMKNALADNRAFWIRAVAQKVPESHHESLCSWRWAGRHAPLTINLLSLLGRSASRVNLATAGEGE